MLSDDVKKLEKELEQSLILHKKVLEITHDLIEMGDLHPWVESEIKKLQSFAGKGPKYTLHVKIDTDQDATIRYKGKEYCFYGQDDLMFTDYFEGLDELADHLLVEVHPLEGGKATQFIRDWLAGCARAIRTGGGTEFSTCGNQEMYIDVIKNY